MDDLAAQRAAAIKFATEHVREMAAELLEWQDTSILRDGKVRELAKMCAFADYHALKVAEHFVHRAALEVAAGVLKS